MNEKVFHSKATKLANAVLFVGGLGCLLVLAYFLFHYALTGNRQMTSPVGVLVYYVAPAVASFVLFMSLRLPAAQKINLGLLVFAAAASLFALESSLSVWSNLPSVVALQNLRLRISSAKAMGINFDTRNGGEVITDLHTKGVEAVPDVFPASFIEDQENGTRKSLLQAGGAEFIPIAGISNKLVVFCNETGQWLMYTSDEHGFNNSNDVWHKPQIDIAAIGDSYVEGMCVGEKDNLVALIRKQYPATLNLGKESSGSLLHLATVKEYAQVVRPKVVLWFFYENDIWQDLMGERRSPLLMRYMTPNFSQDLFHRQAEIDRALTDYIVSVSNQSPFSRLRSDVSVKLKDIFEIITDPQAVKSLAYDVVKLSELRQRLGLVKGTSQINDAQAESIREKILEAESKQMEEMRPELELFPRILQEAKKTVNQWGGKMYFIFLPSWDRYMPPEFGRPERDAVLRAAREAGIPVIDLHPVFAAQGDPLKLFPPFPVTSHYNERGNQLVAEEVLRSISVKD